MTDPTGRELIVQLTTAPRLLPESDELRAFIQACDREEAVSPIFSPSAYMAAQGRLRALRRLASAALQLRDRLDDLDEVTAEESNPERDRALGAAHRAIMEDLGS